MPSMSVNNIRAALFAIDNAISEVFNFGEMLVLREVVNFLAIWDHAD